MDVLKEPKRMRSTAIHNTREDLQGSKMIEKLKKPESYKKNVSMLECWGCRNSKKPENKNSGATSLQ